MWKKYQKYLAFYKHIFIQSLDYRSELLIWVVLDTIPTLILFFVWKAIFADNQAVQGYDLSRMIEFYFYFTLINNLTSAHFEQREIEEIRQGKIDHFLTHPFPYLAKVFWQHISRESFYLLILLPALLLIALLIQIFFHISFSSISLFQATQFLFLMVTGILVQFLLGLLIVLAGFWFEGADGLEHFKWITLTLLGGSIIPRVFLPKTLQFLVGIFPFQYLYSMPIEIIQGIHTLALFDVIYILGFILGLWIFCQWLWKRAQYKYTSAGG